MTNLERYNLIIAIVQESRNIVWRDDITFDGDVTLSQGVIPLLKAAYENGIISLNEISKYDGDLNFIDINDHIDNVLSYTMNIPVPSKEIAIVRNMEGLLRISTFLINPPNLYYEIDSKTNSLPQSYLDTIKFCNLLIQISDHYDDIGNIKKCYLYAGIQISITIKYSYQDMCILPEIDQLISSYDNPPHLDERKKILKEIIIQNSIGEPETKIFPHLLTRFTSIKRRFDQDWSLFISDFSISKILDALEIKILNITDKINNSLSELQKTMITIPLAIIFIAPQFADISSNQYKNILLLISLWLFLIFTLIFFWFHKRNLQFIVDELNSIIKHTEDDYPQLSSRIVDIFHRLKYKCKFQSLYRKFIGSLMWISVICVTFFSIYGNNKLLMFILSFLPDSK